jgi:hypothetical protein
MHMLLEKTFLKVNVLTVELRVDETTTRRIHRIDRSAAGEGRTHDAIVAAVMDADSVAIELRFRRDVDLDEFVDAVRDSLEDAEEAAMISDATRREVARRLPQWYRSVARRGFEDGDRLRYRLSGNTVQTTLRSVAGEVLLQQVDRGAERRRALLAGYFAPGTDFREPLLDSVVGCAGR